MWTDDDIIEYEAALTTQERLTLDAMKQFKDFERVKNYVARMTHGNYDPHYVASIYYNPDAYFDASDLEIYNEHI